MSSSRPQAVSGPRITVNKNSCTMSANAWPVHANPATAGGVVTFNAPIPCTINFTDATVFGMSSKALVQGDNPLPIVCEQGQTNVTIDGCKVTHKHTGSGPAATTLTAMSAGSGPSDIIVP